MHTYYVYLVKPTNILHISAAKIFDENYKELFNCCYPFKDAAEAFCITFCKGYKLGKNSN